MAYNCGCVMLIIIFLAATTNTHSVEAAREFKVGDDFGWRVPDPNNTAFYTEWAERNRFQVGDSLVFEYEDDSVLSVEKWDYFHCDANDPITAFDNGKSTLNLDRPGAFYFISGTEDHCNNGEKLFVEVMSPHPIPTPTPESQPPFALPPEGLPPSPMAPSPYEGFSPMASSPSASITEEFSASPVLSSAFVAPFATFVAVLLLAL